MMMEKIRNQSKPNTCRMTTSAVDKRKRRGLLREPLESVPLFDTLQKQSRKLMRVLENKGPASKDDCHMDHFYEMLVNWMRYAERGDKNSFQAAQEADILLQAMERNVDNRNKMAINPTTEFYCTVLQAFALCNGRRKAAEMAQTILHRMISRKRDNPEHNFRRPNPSTKAFNIVLNCWKHCGEEDVGTMGDRLVYETMHELNQEHNRAWSKPCFPDESTMTTLIGAWTTSRHPRAPERCMEILQEYIDQSMERGVPLKRMVFHSTMYALSRRRNNALPCLEKILNEMKDLSEASAENDCSPNGETFGILFQAFRIEEDRFRDGKAAEKAESLLKRMVLDYQTGSSSVRPISSCFAICMDAWSKTNPPQPRRAENIFRLQCEVYEDSQDLLLRPDVACLNSVLTAWSRCREDTQAPEHMEAFIADQRRLVQVDVSSYNILMNAYAIQGRTDVVEKLLQDIKSEGLQPTSYSYTALLRSMAMSKENTVSKALQILDFMEKSDSRDLLPNRFSYSYVLDAIAKEVDCFAEAKELLNRVGQRYRSGVSSVSPTSFMAVSAIKACANVTTLSYRRMAIRTVKVILEEVEEGCYGAPNEAVYESAAQTIALIAEEREHDMLLRWVFDLSCRNSCLSRNLFLFVRDNSSSYVPVLGELELLWSARVPEYKRPIQDTA